MMKTVKLWNKDHWETYSYNEISDLQEEFLKRKISVASNVTLGEVFIGYGSVINYNTNIGDNVVIGNNVIIKDNVTIEEDSIIEDYAIIHTRARVGKNVHLKENCQVGYLSTIGDNSIIDVFVIIGREANIPEYSRVRESIQFTSPKDPLYWYSINHLRIGCQAQSLFDMKDNHKILGAEHGYTPEDIEPYTDIIDFCIKRYNKLNNDLAKEIL